jgi:pilus assembly protein CpaE
MARAICVHQIEDIDPATIPGYLIAARTGTAEELRNAVGTLPLQALIVDLDEPAAIQTIVMALEIHPKLPVVGVTGKSDLPSILLAQRAGCAYITARPIDANDLLAALRQACGGDRETASTGETLAILGSIGGAGGTTLASHLAVELALLTERPTALFDLDLEFGGVAAVFDMSSSFTIADLATAGAVDASLLERAAIKLTGGLHVFDRPRTVRDAHSIDDVMIRMILEVASESYPYILLDLPRRLDAITGAAIERCNRLILVVQLTVPSIKNARRMIEALESEGISRDRIQLVVNRYSKNLHNLTVEMVEDQLKARVLGLVPSDFQAVHQALDVGSPLAKRSTVRNAIRDIAVRLSGQQDLPKAKSWFSKLSLTR